MNIQIWYFIAVGFNRRFAVYVADVILVKIKTSSIMRIKFLFIILTSFIFQISFAQSKYPELLKKKQFEKAEAKADKTLEKNPDDIEANFYKAAINIHKKNENLNSDVAYRYALIADSLYALVTDKEEIKDLKKKKISKSGINSSISKAMSLRYSQAVKDNTLEAYQNLLSDMPNADEGFKQRVHDKIELIHFNNIQDKNSIAAYQQFLDTHPQSAATEKAKARISELAFDKAAHSNTKKSYKDFVDTYPDSKEFSEAKKRYKALQWLVEDPIGCWCKYSTMYETAAKENVVNMAADSLLAIGERRKNIAILQYCVNHFSGEKRDKAFLLLHDIITDDGEMASLDLFYKKNGDPLFQDIRVEDYRLAAMGDLLKLEKEYYPGNFEKYDAYIKEAAPRERAFVALQRYMSPEIKKKQYDIALAKLEVYAKYFGKNNQKINDLRALLQTKVDKSIQIKSIGPPVNTVSGGEYVPVITADGKLMYFCGKSRPDSVGGEDIYVAKNMNDNWVQPELVRDLSMSSTNDAPLSVSADGTQLLMFISGQINYAKKTKTGWTRPVPYPKQINSERWQADAMITSDGRAMLFTSIRPDGYGLVDARPYHGSYHYAADIYVSVLDENDEWGEPINLGSVINTQYCDRMPFLHPDMKTLYFSSDGHGGLGGLDVYKSTRLADSCWNCWSEPVNLGKEINTESHDWGYKITTEGDKAYFAKGVRGEASQDIYSVNLPVSMRPDLVATISGKLLNDKGEAVDAEIVWEDLVTGQIIGKSQADPKDGSYFIVLPLGKMYGYYVEKDGYFPLSDNVDLRNHKESVKINKDITMISITDMVDKGVAVPITNLFFNTNESVILPYSIPELKRVAGILKSQGLKVEIRGHTDNVGDAAKNQVLSENRAKAVKEFLVKEGYDDALLTTKGYGATKPIADNNTDAGRAKNRRVELRIVK